MSVAWRRYVALALVALVIGAPIVAAVVSYEPVSGEITLETNSGVEVTTDEHGGDMELTSPFVDDETVALTTPSGNLTVSGSGQASVFIDSFGPPLVVTNMSVSNAVTLDPPNKPALTVEGQTSNLTYYDPALDDGAADLEYAGASGETTVTFRGLAADTTVSVIDVAGADNTLLAVGETNADGNLTVTLPNSGHTVELQSGDASSPPVLSDLSPSGEVSGSPITASVEVDDDDFDSAAENVTVSLYVDGTKVTTQNLTSPGTVSTTVSNLDGGQHNLTATAVDAFGNTDRVETTFGVPANLTVVNESDTSQVIPGATVTFSFVGNDTVVRRQANANGNVSLSGLPLDRPVIAEVEAPDYYTRTYYWPSLAEYHTAYLLPENATVADVVYVLDDQTGKFSPAEETALLIQKPINTTGGNAEYVTVISDRFDATGELPVTLETGERYRLKVMAPNGDIRAIGNYKVAGDDPNAVLTIGVVRLAGDTEEGTAFGARLEESASGDRVIRYRYVDPDDTTAALNVTVYRTGNESNVLLPETTVATDIGTYTETLVVPDSAPDDVAYTIKYEATMTDGSTTSDKRFVGDVPEVAKQFGLAPNVLSLLGWFTLLGTTGLVAITDRGAAAVVAVILAPVLVWIGALSIPWPLLGIGGGIAVLMNFGRFQP